MRRLLSFCLILAPTSLFAQNYLSHLPFDASATGTKKLIIKTAPDGSHFISDALLSAMDADPGEDVFTINASDLAGRYISKFDPAFNFEWSIFIPDANWGFGNMTVDGNGEVYISSSFAGTVDFDPSSGETILSSGVLETPYIAKYSSDGELIWVRSYGESTVDYSSTYPNGLTVNSSNEVLVIGSFFGNVDFDPSEEVHELASDYGDTYIQKMDSNGDWLGVYNLNAISQGSHIACDQDDNIIISGEHSDPIDLDSGPGENLVEMVGGGSDIYLIKLDSNGEGLWGVSYPWPTFYSDPGDYVRIDPEGNVLLTGMLNSTTDFDPSESEALYEYEGWDGYWFIAKYSPEGAYLWHAAGEGPSVIASTSDSDGSIYISGRSTVGADMDAGLGEFIINSDEDQNIYFMKYSPDGEFAWCQTLESSSMNWSTTMHWGADNTLYLAGFNQDGLDLDPSEEAEVFIDPGPGSWIPFLAWYDAGACGNVIMTIDQVNDVNCETQTATLSASFIEGTAPFDFEWSSGQTGPSIEAAGSGIYQVTGTDADGCQRERSVLVNGPTSFDQHDLVVNALATNFVPGFEGQVFIEAENMGCTSATGTVSVTIDEPIEILSVDPPADEIVGNTLVWNFSNWEPGIGGLVATIAYLTPEDLALGEMIQITSIIQPIAGDFDQANNTKHELYEVVGAWDPNDIQVWPQGEGEEGFIEANTEMTYKIRFQNTGTAPAVNVNILNEIDPNFDLSSIQVIASSHEMHTELFDDNTLNFVFENIMLPDSTNNEPESHGYVIYTIDQQPDLPPLATMENWAGIYFDFNEAVITNTVLNTIDDPTDDITEQVLPKLSVFPNPADASFTVQADQEIKTVRLSTITGNQVITKHIQAAKKTTVDINQLSPGVYVLGLEMAGGRVVRRKLVVR